VVAGSAVFDGKAARENARQMLQAVAEAKGGRDFEEPME
jgi:hypothetical protein